MPVPQYLHEVCRTLPIWLDAQAKRFPGLAVGIVYKDNVIFSQCKGVARPGEPITSKTGFRIASISKIFTSLAILKLVESKKLKLEDLVSAHLPWFFAPQYPELTNITIQDLLMHVSGLTRDGHSDHWVTDKFPTFDALQKSVTSLGTVWPPGKQWKYSNLGFAVLGSIIEQVSKKSYNEFLTEEILGPMGLHMTSTDLPARSKMATGYSRRNIGKRRPFDRCKTHSFAPATGFASNLEDMCRFTSHLITKDVVLKKAGWKILTDKVRKVENLPATMWGLGLHIWDLPTGKLIGHSGGFQGYETVVAIDHEEEIGVSVLINSIDGNAIGLMLGIFAQIRSMKKKLPALKSAKVETSRYHGVFSNRWGIAAFTTVGKSLLMYEPTEHNPFESCEELEHIKDNTFKIVSGPGFGSVGEQVTFEFSKKGDLLSVVIGPNRAKKKD